MLKKPLLSLFVAMAMLPAPARADATGGWPNLAAISGARVSAQIVDLDSGNVLSNRNGAQRLSPASISKLVIAAAALDTWAADKTFETRAIGLGALREGRLQGDLVLNGDGDATFDHRDLWMLAGQVRAAGVRQVSGGIVAEPAFGPVPCGNVDRCEALLKSKSAYDVPLTMLAVDYGTWCVEIAPTVPGQAAELRTCSGVRLPIPVQGQVATVGAKTRASYRVLRVTENGRDQLQVSGAIPVGRPAQVYRSMSDPALGMAALFRQMLVELGVSVSGPAGVRYSVSPANGERLGAVSGLPLREQLGRMNRYSNNFIADQLTLSLAAARTPQRPKDLSSASLVLGEYLAMLAGETQAAPRLFSGSGLTPENELSASDMVALLAHMYRNTANFPVFYGGLTVPRQSPFSFIAGGSDAWQDRVALKTGTLTEPDPVRTLAGYIRKQDGGWLAFAVLVNGSTANRAHNNPTFIKAIRADLEALLARY